MSTSMPSMQTDSHSSHVPSVQVHAEVWKPDRTQLPLDQVVAAVQASTWKGDALTMTQLALFTSDLSICRALQVFHGSYVKVHATSSKRKHIARLVLLRGAPLGAQSVVLSPMLAFNLGLALYTRSQASTEVSLSSQLALLRFLASVFPHRDDVASCTVQTLSISPIAWADIGLPQPLAALQRTHAIEPAIASRAVIAPIYVSMMSHRDHKLMEEPHGMLSVLRAYFQRRRVVQEGDILAVPIHERYPTMDVTGDVQAPAIDDIQVYHLPASLMAQIQEDSDPRRQLVGLAHSFPIDSAMLFFRVESLILERTPASHDEPASVLPSALAIDSTTELLQTTTVSCRAPDEQLVRAFHHACHDGTPCMRSTGDIHTPFVDQLYDLLYPSQCSRLPVSVLLAGPRGCGKTTMVHQVARLLGVFVLQVSFTELTAASELQLLDNLRQYMLKAQAVAPCILYISRLFAIDKANEEAELRIGAVLSECMRQLAHDCQIANIPVIACVEDLNDVPKFIRQCFLYELQVETPDHAMRVDIINQLVRHSAPHVDPSVEIAQLAQWTTGRSFADLRVLFSEAGAHAIDRKLVHSLPSTERNEAPRIIQADFEAALRHLSTLSSSSKISNVSVPNVKWDDVGGLEDVKEEILDVVQLPIKHPELFTSGVRQRSGILLYGPPGTGKTLLAKAIATECNMSFLSVKGPELLNMYIGESEKNVRQVFARARSCRPCILFFDELDSLAPMRGRGSDSGGVMDRVVSQLLTEIDGLSGSGGNDQIFVIGATNRPDLLEAGLLRPGRFDRLLYLGICTDKKAQLKVVQALTRKFDLAPDVELDAVVAQCPLTFTGADFYALCSNALAAALKDRVQELEQRLDEINAEDCYSSNTLTIRAWLNKLPPEELTVKVSQAHFLTSLEQVVPSVSPSELAHYEQLRDQYSSK